MSKTEADRLELFQQGAFLKQLSNVTTDALPEDFPADLPFHEALSGWAAVHMKQDQATLFDRMFSPEALKDAFAQDQTKLIFDFEDQIGPPARRRLSLRLLSDPDGDLLCVSRLCELPPEPAPVKAEPSASSAADQQLLQAVIQPYLLFFTLDLNRPQIRPEDILRDVDHLSTDVSLPCAYADFLQSISRRYVRDAWADEFLSAFSAESLASAAKDNQKVLRRSFSSEAGPLRMDAYLPGKEDGIRRCSLGICPVEEESSSLMVASSGEAMHNALEDLQLEMQMERDETRKKHRRTCLLLVLLTVIVGIASGAVMVKKLPEFSRVLDSFLPAPATEEPAVTPPPAASTAAPVPETVVTWVARTQPVEFTAEIMENGTSRMNTSSVNYESIHLTASVADVLDPAWFEKQYARNSYPLDGTEAAVHLKLRFDAGETLTSLIPQEAFEIRVTDENGNSLEGYQIMSQPMGGTYQVSVAADTETDLYKRYQHTEAARYLVLACYQNGGRHEIRFALRFDDPNVNYDDLKQGDRGDFVQAMKLKLIALGYLPERAANNNQFNGETTSAVKAAQEAFGMEPTGIATTAFLKKLYGGSSESVSEATPEAAATTAP